MLFLIYFFDILKVAYIIFTSLSLILSIFNIWFSHEAFCMIPEQDIVKGNTELINKNGYEDLHNSNNQQNFPPNSRKSHLLSFIPDTWLGPLTETQAKGVIELKITVGSASPDFYIRPQMDFNIKKITKFYYGPPIATTETDSISK